MVANSINQKPSPADIIISPLRRDLKITEDHASANKEHSWIIYDPVNGKYFRIQTREHTVISLLSREISLKDLAANVASTGLKFTENELIAIINFLSTNSLTVGRYSITENLINRRNQLKKSAMVQKGLSSMLFLRIPVWNPDKFLDKTKDTISFLFNKWTLIAFALLSLSGYICAIPQWTRLSGQFYSSLSYKGLIQYSLSIIILKILHEFAHAYTAKALDIPVRKFGLFFIIFFPRLYTDLTDSWRLTDRKKRILIDSAGIIFEIAVGGMAALLWLNTGAGLINSISYYLFVVSTISAILVNGNPLIKFDGYFLLMDILNIDNLQKEGTTVLRHSVYKRILGIRLPDDSQTMLPSWKKNLLIVYAISSFIYRFFLYTGIILILYFMFMKSLAIILIFVEIYTLFILPLRNELKAITTFKKSISMKKAIISSSAVFILVLLVVLPLPWNIEAPCEVSSLNAVSIFAHNEGFLKNFIVPNGAKVKSGDELLVLENPFLKMEVKESNVELDILNTEKHIASTKYGDLAIIKIKEEQIAGVKNNLSETMRKQELLNVKAPISGVFALYDSNIKNGKWLNKGEPIGEVVDPEKTVIFSYIEEKNISMIKTGDSAYTILSGEISGFSGKVTAVSLVPSDDWRYSPLLDVSGGPIQVLKQNNNGTYDLMENYYRVIITPDESINIQQGRTGKTKIREYSSIAGNFFRFVLSVFYKESSF